MEKAKLYFIIGSSGVGKTTIVPLLKSLLSDFDIHDFDEKLTAEIANNSSLLDHWRKETTKYWIDVAIENAKLGKSTIIVGLVYPKEVEELKPDIETSFYLLNASDEKIRERLMGKRFSTPEKVKGLRQATGQTPEEFITQNKIFMDSLRQEINSIGGTIIDTTNDLPEDVAKKLVSLIVE